MEELVLWKNDKLVLRADVCYTVTFKVDVRERTVRAAVEIDFGQMFV